MTQLGWPRGLSKWRYLCEVRDVGGTGVSVGGISIVRSTVVIVKGISRDINGSISGVARAR